MTKSFYPEVLQILWNDSIRREENAKIYSWLPNYNVLIITTVMSGNGHSTPTRVIILTFPFYLSKGFLSNIQSADSNQFDRIKNLIVFLEEFKV